MQKNGYSNDAIYCHLEDIAANESSEIFDISASNMERMISIILDEKRLHSVMVVTGMVQS